MINVIKEQTDLCVGCNRCVRECPMEMANVTYLDEAGNIKVVIDRERCIACGACLLACKHDARVFADDTGRFFHDLSKGVPISLMAAPAVKTNIPEYKRLFTYLKQLGVHKIYDVSLGADICIWAHTKFLEGNGVAPIISQPCPPIVLYCEIYRNDLLGKLSPIHSPMACTSIYMKEYQGIHDRIAALSPCMAKAVEFEETKLADYNVTFGKLLEYLKKNNINLPEAETGFDHAESGLGSLFPMPGGFKENMEYILGKRLHITKAEGPGVYERLNKYAVAPEEFLPDIYDVLNCAEGCNIGSASSHGRCIFEIGKTMKNNARKVREEHRRADNASVFEAYDAAFDFNRFTRIYRPIPTVLPNIIPTDIEKAFESLGKTDYEKQHIDCYACGSKTCYDMARKIALNVNIPDNCIIKSKEDARLEHEENLLVHAQIVEMEKERELDERIRTMFDSAPFAAHFWGEGLTMTDCNEAAAKMFNITKEEYVRRYYEFMPEFQPDGKRSVDRLRELVAKTFEVGYQKTELMCLTVDGEQVPVEDTYVCVDYKGTKIVAGYSRDLREHKKMLRDNEFQIAVLNMVLKTANIGLWDMNIQEDRLNPDNPITWSDEFRRIMGYKNERDFPNVLKMWGDRLHPEDAEKTAKAILDHWADKTGNTPYDAEFRIKRKNNEYAHIKASSATIRDDEGNPVRSAGTLIDMTEIKNLINEAEKQRAEAESANKAKSEFLSHISHEIRTPMNAILGTAEIHLQKEANAPETEEAFNTIYASGNLLLNIINDILDLSKIEAGRLELKPAQYDIPSIIYDTVQLNLLRYESKPIAFELFIDENTPLDLLGDELRIKQIINNILSNAFKYTEEGKVELSVAAETNGQTDCVLILRVSDTGHGMTREQLNELFDPYTRFNIDTNRTIVGTGLGMHITKRLVESMEGEITVESEYGKGSVFTVRLPQKRVGTNQCGADIAERLSNSNFKSTLKVRRKQIVNEYMPYGNVMIVDDVESNLYVARGMMMPYGMKIKTVSSGFEAIDNIKKGRIYDIIFMDHMMPKMDGIEATKILREMGYSHPIVAMTANAVTGSAEMFLSSGFDGYISKPVDIRELNNALNRLIRDKQPKEVIEAARLQIDRKKKSNKNALHAAVVRDMEHAVMTLKDILSDTDEPDDTALLLYTTTVHGMKSALTNIGEGEHSATALRLEKAGSGKDIPMIKSETPAFVNTLKGLIEKYRSKPGAFDDVLPPGDRDFLYAKLNEIKAACQRIKKSEAKSALETLKEKQWPREINGLLEEIADYLLLGKFKMIITAVESARF
jgi:PAS domain S-box-containing protein